jgi:integral membrane protein (TIGR01906 family)
LLSSANPRSSQPAPWPVGLAYGLALALVILLLGPLLLFNPLFTSALQARHAVAAAFGTEQREIDRVTTAYLVDIYTSGSFDEALEPGGAPLLDERERSHMSDVSNLVRILAAVTVVAGIVAIAAGHRLRHEPRRQGRIMLVTAGALGAAALVIGLAFAVAFDATFLAFHAIFFPPGTYLFEPGSDLITLFPGGFWFDASLAAGAAVLLTAVALAIIGLRRWRAGAGTLTGP